VDLPVNPPIPPMLAKRVDELPAKGDWIFEPSGMVFARWCFAMEMRFSSKSRDENHSIVTFLSCWNHLRAALPARCVLDGEMVIVKNDGLDFVCGCNSLASGCIARKAVIGTEPGIICILRSALPWRSRSLRRRRFKSDAHQLEVALLDLAAPPIHLTPANTPIGALPPDWSAVFEGAGLDV